MGGVWDVDNVRLTENFSVPNASFETPFQPGAPYYASPAIDFWQETPQPAYYTTNFSTNPWYQMVGEFTNDPGDGAYITNCDGNQAAFLQSLPEVGIFQDYNSFSITQTGPTYAFNAIFRPGNSYTLKAGIIGDSAVGLPQGATMQMNLYYRDAANNMITVASTTITNTTSVFPNNLGFVDFTVQTPTVQSTDPWAAKNIGIEFVCTVTTNNMGGAWDVDNVRLVEAPMLAALGKPVLVNGLINLGLQGPPGQVFNIQANTDLTTTNWSTVATVTNTSGASWITDFSASGNQRFYRAKKM
jgi:hypothetical protein